MNLNENETTLEAELSASGPHPACAVLSQAQERQEPALVPVLASGDTESGAVGAPCIQCLDSGSSCELRLRESIHGLRACLKDLEFLLDSLERHGLEPLSAWPFSDAL